MDKKNIFQYVLLGIFGLAIFIGVLIFSGAIDIGNSKQKSGGQVAMWGTVDRSAMSSIIESYGYLQKDITVNYVQIPLENFHTQLVEAIAKGQGPDLILFPNEDLFNEQALLMPIPYASLSQRTFKDTYIQEAELFLNSEGTIALPFSVDPLVLYYNRDLFSNAAIAKPPAHWQDVAAMVPKLTIRDDAANVTQSAIAMGGYSNINNAKSIISALLLQVGIPIVVQSDITSQTYEARLNLLNAEDNGVQAMSFYTNFADPTKDTYSWNKSLPDSLASFVAGKSAMYVGYASELFDIQGKNPNLNFDVVELPQAQGTNRLTYGKMNAIGILKSSRNSAIAFSVATALAGPSLGAEVATKLSLPPPARSLLATRPNDPYMATFYDSALIARGWIDPDPNSTNQIFNNMVNDILSGRSSVRNAISKAQSEINIILRR